MPLETVIRKSIAILYCTSSTIAKSINPFNPPCITPQKEGGKGKGKKGNKNST